MNHTQRGVLVGFGRIWPNYGRIFIQLKRNNEYHSFRRKQLLRL